MSMFSNGLIKRMSAGNNSDFSTSCFHLVEYLLSCVYTITNWLSIRLPYGDIWHSLTNAGIR